MACMMMIRTARRSRPPALHGWRKYQATIASQQCRRLSAQPAAEYRPESTCLMAAAYGRGVGLPRFAQVLEATIQFAGTLA
jgi:hypothetical protein